MNTLTREPIKKPWVMVDGSGDLFTIYLNPLTNQYRTSCNFCPSDMVNILQYNQALVRAFVHYGTQHQTTKSNRTSDVDIPSVLTTVGVQDFNIKDYKP